MGHVGRSSNRTTALLPADARGHELLWSRNRVVELEDNSLAGKDCVSIRPTATQVLLTGLKESVPTCPQMFYYELLY